MVANFADLKDRIARDLEPWLDRLNGDEIGQAVLDAIEHYTDEPMWFLDTVSSGLTLTANQPSDDLPTDLIAIDEITVLVGDDNYPLETVPYDRYRWLQTTPTALVGQPFQYSLFQSKIWWYPTPDQNYPYTLYYRRRLPALSADSDTNEWITFGWRLLRWHAEADLGIGPLAVPGERVGTWMAAAENEKRKLMRKSIDRMVLDHGRPRDF